MKQSRILSRRSFLATVVGGAASVGISGRAEAAQGCTDSDPAPPRGDPGGRGRRCTTPTPTPTPTTGCSDSDPSPPRGDPGGRGRRCTTPTPTPTTGCSDNDPTDPGGRGRNCGGITDGAYPTGRRERRTEVCWVDHPSRSNAECNMQTYTEWMTTYSDGRVVYDTADADRRKAEMTARGYTARWHRILVNW